MKRTKQKNYKIKRKSDNKSTKTKEQSRKNKIKQKSNKTKEEKLIQLKFKFSFVF